MIVVLLLVAAPALAVVGAQTPALAAVGAQTPALEPGGTFVDDDGSVHESFIEAIAAAGITRGCDAADLTRFCPSQPVTRAQMAGFLARALELTDTSGRRFADVPTSSPFVEDIDRLATVGITRGCDPTAPTRFCPGQPITRGQLAGFLVRGLALDTGPAAPFLDVPDRHTFAAEIGILAATGITGGCTPQGTHFCPAEVVTRGQMASFLGRALGLEPIPVQPRPVLPDDPVLPDRPAPPGLHGNASGAAPIPAVGQPRDVSDPDQVIGDGTPASCTSAAVVEAVARGGTIVFDCGPEPVTIALQDTARIVNDTGPEIVLDGGGLITLDGGGRHRILYLNTCDPAQVWTTPHCDDQDHPRLTVQNLSFVRGFVAGEDLLAGGGAIFARGGRLTVINSAFHANGCAEVGPDVGGGAIRAFDQAGDEPVHVVHSTFGGGPGLGNTCSNGGALSSIGVSWVIVNSLLTDNRAVGVGAKGLRVNYMGVIRVGACSSTRRGIRAGSGVGRPSRRR